MYGRRARSHAARGSIHQPPQKHRFHFYSFFFLSSLSTLTYWEFVLVYFVLFLSLSSFACLSVSVVLGFFLCTNERKNIHTHTHTQNDGIVFRKIYMMTALISMTTFCHYDILADKSHCFVFFSLFKKSNKKKLFQMNRITHLFICLLLLLFSLWTMHRTKKKNTHNSANSKCIFKETQWPKIFISFAWKCQTIMCCCLCAFVIFDLST